MYGIYWNWNSGSILYFATYFQSFIAKSSKFCQYFISYHFEKNVQYNI